MEGEREVTGSSIFTRTCRAPNCTVWDKGFQLSPGKELRPQTSFPFVAAIMPSVWGQRCPRPSRGGRSPASLSVLAKVQRASCPPAGGRGCMWGGSFLMPPFIPGPQFQGAAAGVSGEDGRGGQKGAGRVGEAKGELTFCAPRRRGSDMKH